MILMNTFKLSVYITINNIGFKKNKHPKFSLCTYLCIYELFKIVWFFYFRLDKPYFIRNIKYKIHPKRNVLILKLPELFVFNLDR